MELSEYIFALDKGEPAVGKDGIVLPEALRDKFTELYEMSEKMGAEHGCALFFDRKTRKFDYSKVASGGKTSMNIPESDHPDNFGNVHAHPSKSIGHKGGHSPHSMQDLLTFAKTSDRKSFIQFVVSGPKVYAMVYSKGHSRWDGTVAKYLNTRKDASEESTRDLLYQAAGGAEEYMKVMSSVESEKQAEEYLERLRKEVKNYGKHMEEVAFQECAAFAKQFKYVFIQWNLPKNDCLVM